MFLKIAYMLFVYIVFDTRLFNKQNPSETLQVLSAKFLISILFVK